MQQRGLTENDLLAAAKTYHPSGLKDEYVVFSSGGQSGQVIVYGVPSMRILEVHCRLHPGTLAGLRLWRSREHGNPGTGLNQC